MLEKMFGKIIQFLKEIRQFLKEVRIEFKKVTWPNRKETTSATFIVILLTVVVGFYLFLCDLVLSRGMEPLFLGTVTFGTALVVLFLAGILTLVYYTTKK